MYDADSRWPINIMSTMLSNGMVMLLIMLGIANFNTNRWAFSRHCVPVICPSGFTEKCCWCTCCKKHGRWRPECLERLDIIRYFSPKGQLFSGCPCRRLERQHCEPRRGSGKEHKTGGKGAGPNFWKNDKAQGHNINQLKSDGSKMTSQIQLNLDPQSAS